MNRPLIAINFFWNSGPTNLPYNPLGLNRSPSPILTRTSYFPKSNQVLLCRDFIQVSSLVMISFVGIDIIIVL